MKSRGHQIAPPARRTAPRSRKVFVGMDIGGTKFLVAAADENARVIQCERAATPRPLGEGLRLLHEMIASVSGGARIAGIAAGAGGPLDWKTGVVSPLHQPEWRGVPLKRIMEKRYRCGFSVDVDTNVAALAEYHHARRKISKLLYLTLSTGMGGGFIIDGEIYRGLKGAHPEVGHQAVPCRAPGGRAPSCPCGTNGCLEALVSGTGIRRLYGKPPEELGPKEWEEVSWNLGQGLRNLAAIYSPDIIVLGGGITFGAGRSLLAPAARVMRDHLRIVPAPTVRASTLGEQNVMQGAILLALRANLARPPLTKAVSRDAR